jgi:hypothetical protein
MSAAESLTRAVLRVVASDDMLEGVAVADETFDGDETPLVEVLRASGFHGPVDADGIALFLSDLPVGVPVRVGPAALPDRDAVQMTPEFVVRDKWLEVAPRQILDLVVAQPLWFESHDNLRDDCSSSSRRRISRRFSIHSLRSHSLSCCSMTSRSRMSW